MGKSDEFSNRVSEGCRLVFPGVSIEGGKGMDVDDVGSLRGYIDVESGGVVEITLRKIYLKGELIISGFNIGGVGSGWMRGFYHQEFAPTELRIINVRNSFIARLEYIGGFGVFNRGLYYNETKGTRKIVSVYLAWTTSDGHKECKVDGSEIG